MQIDAFLDMNILTSKGDRYGPLRRIDDRLPSHWTHAFTKAHAEPFAQDSCGNFFVQHDDRRVGFWDHETNEITWLAEDEKSFAAMLTNKGPEVELKPEQVISVWVDPAFKAGLERLK